MMIGIGSSIKLFLILLIIGSLLAAGWYVTGMREQLAISQNNNEKYEQAVFDQQLLIKQIKEDVQSIQEANNELASVVKKQNNDLNSLHKKFEKTKPDGTVRDIGKIAVRRPESIERIINNATKNSLRCLEIASGAPLTEDEKYGKKINTECPALMPDNGS
tara:strand:+ start:6340 stop:6822 length:483 start_codon:yes stop_codon:yes gene_type:complete